VNLAIPVVYIAACRGGFYRINGCGAAGIKLAAR